MFTIFGSVFQQAGKMTKLCNIWNQLHNIVKKISLFQQVRRRSDYLGILNFRQFSEQPALPVKKCFATRCTKFICKTLNFFRDCARKKWLLLGSGFRVQKTDDRNQMSRRSSLSNGAAVTFFVAVLVPYNNSDLREHWYHRCGSGFPAAIKRSWR